VRAIARRFARFTRFARCWRSNVARNGRAIKRGSRTRIVTPDIVWRVAAASRSALNLPVEISRRRVYRVNYERVTESVRRPQEGGGRGDTRDGTRFGDVTGPGFIAGRIARNGAMSESRVHPVISRYSFVPGGNSIKGEPRARARAVPLALSSLIFSSLPLSLSLSLSLARARGGWEERGTRETSLLEDTSMEVVAIRWCATRLPRR